MSQTEGEFVEVEEVVARVGRSLDEGTPTLVEELAIYLGDRIPELRDDLRLKELLRASIAANLTTICHMMVNRIAVEATEAPPAAVEYALRHAQNDMPGSTLVRAYMVGQALLLQRAMDLVHSQSVVPDRENEAIRIISQLVHSYTDRVLQTLIDAHELERRQWLNARARVRRDTVVEYIRNESMRDVDFVAETDFALTGHHVGFLAWLPEIDTHEDGTIETHARRIASILSPGDNPLIVVADSAMAWGWVHVRAGFDAASARSELSSLNGTPRIALGGAQEGPAGFRRTHQQAQDAHLVALRAPAVAEQRIVGYSDEFVGIAAVMLRDPRESRRWVLDKLGSLAGSTASAKSMRETLIAYAAQGQSFARTADVLDVHRNTVMSRIERFTESRDGSSMDLSEIILAIRMLDFLPTN